jgi:hypothetical protein
MKRTVCFVVLATTLGCQPAIVTYPHCPVPVLISKVNRVGVRTPSPVRITGLEDILHASSGYVAQASSSTTTTGNVRTTTTQSSYVSAGPMTLTLEALQLVPNKNDVEATDIMLDGVWTGNFFFNGLTGFYNQVWGDPKGRKVWVR